MASKCPREHPLGADDDECERCGAPMDMACPYDGLDSSMLNIKPAAVCVLGTPSDFQECSACQ